MSIPVVWYIHGNLVRNGTSSKLAPVHNGWICPYKKLKVPVANRSFIIKYKSRNIATFLLVNPQR